MILTGNRTLKFIFFIAFFIAFFLLQAVMNLTTGIRTLNFNGDGQMLLMASQAKKEALRYSSLLGTLLALLVQKYKYWRCTPSEPSTLPPPYWCKSTYTDACFAGPKIQILTLRTSESSTLPPPACTPTGLLQVRSLLALLVKNYQFWRCRRAGTPLHSVSCTAFRYSVYLLY